MSSTNKPVLKIDWATHEAARFACENWHYSKSVPLPPLVKVGVWEDSKFIGVVLFSRGASPMLGAAYDLKQTECCELTRVSLTKHKTSVSRIIAIAIKFLKKNNSGLRLIVSFADQNQGHHGGIYQAGGFIYSGESSEKYDYIGPDGKKYLSRQVAESGYVKQFSKVTKVFKRSECVAVHVLGKHRYLMPLDDDMRKQIMPLAKPYPKRAKKQDSERPSELGGAVPTDTLQNAAVNTEE
jgi:hypothetical protein